MLVAPGYLKKTGYYFRAKRDSEMLNLAGHDVCIIGVSSKGFFYDEKGSLSLIKFMKLMLMADILFCENIAPILFAIPFFNKKRVVVLHGGLSDLKPFKFYFIKRILYGLLLSFSISFFNKVICVSKALKDSVSNEKHYEKMVVIPNMPSESFLTSLKNTSELYTKVELKKKIDFDTHKKYICYCGNSQAWQKTDYLVKLFKDISEKTDNINLAILTRDVDEFTLLLDLYNVDKDRVFIGTVDNSEVPSYLLASDLLYLLRDQDDINSVACPTKAIEYLASGVKILISDNLGDISGLIRNEKLGIVVDELLDHKLDFLSDKIIDEINKLPNNFISKLDIKKYSLTNYLENYETL